MSEKLSGNMVDVTFDLGRVLYEKLRAAADFRRLHEMQCNIVVFRHVPPNMVHAKPEQLGRFQLELRRRVIKSGDFYITSTNLHGIEALRFTTNSSLTTLDDLVQLLDTLCDQGIKLVS